MCIKGDHAIEAISQYISSEKTFTSFKQFGMIEESLYSTASSDKANQITAKLFPENSDSLLKVEDSRLNAISANLQRNRSKDDLSSRDRLEIKPAEVSHAVSTTYKLVASPSPLKKISSDIKTSAESLKSQPVGAKITGSVRQSLSKLTTAVKKSVPNIAKNGSTNVSVNKSNKELQK